MLKWAVGQRIPSSASSTCSDITPSIACCSSTFRQNTFKLHTTGTTTVRTAFVRNLKIANKENRRKCRRSLQKEMIKSASSESPRNRGSIYMQLDNVPAALRDVSNHWSHGCENTNEQGVRTRRRNIRLKKSPCKITSHKYDAEHLSNQFSEIKNDIREKSNESHVTLTETFGESLEKKKPCNGEHNIPRKVNFELDQNKTLMLIDNPLYFTIQTSPPEEPDELFHKELPVKRSKKLVNDSCDSVNHDEIRLPLTNDYPICDKDGNPCEVSTLTKTLSWLELNSGNAENLSRLHLLNVSSAVASHDDFEKSYTSSLDITNPNSAIFSETNLSDGTVSSKRSLKRKFSISVDSSPGNETKVLDTIEKFKLKRRCVIFNEQSFPLNTPPLSTYSRQSSDTISIDTEKPSTLKRQRVIRRKNKKQNSITIPQTIYNKNLKSWLTLPNGIPSPFEVSETQFRILSCTPMTVCNMSNTLMCDDEPSHFNVVKKAVSTPKPHCLFNLTEDVFLSPGVRPLLDSIIQTSTENEIIDLKSKNMEYTNSCISPASEETWNSHGKHLVKVTPTINNSFDEDSAQSNNSFRINDDQDIFSTIVSSTPTLASTPMTTIEKQPKTRRCLSFISPTTPKTTTRQNRYETSQLDLKIYYENGILTVHIIRARNLQKIIKELPCNAYVKVNLIPQNFPKNFHRTCVRQNSFNPKFDHKFSMEISENDLNKRILISAWHRDRGKQKSEFLGCMSFAIKNILKKEINGSYKLLSQNSNKSYVLQSQQPQDLMAGQTTYTVEERINSGEKERSYPTSNGNEKLKSMTVTRKEMNKVHEEYLFLQHLELDPMSKGKNPETKKLGRTPFTTTHKLMRHGGSSYGFSIAWTHPPRVERVEKNLPADVAGLKSGDNVIFVNKTNVVTLSEDKILDIIKSCGNQLILEIYRKPVANGTIGNNVVQRCTQLPDKHSSKDSITNIPDSRSTTAYSTATTTSSKKRLQLPQITFSSEDKGIDTENSRQQFVYQLLKKEQQYALCLQFGISRFLLPLAERRDVIRPNEHQTLFQNVQELLRITEDLMERTALEEGQQFGKSIGKIYLKKFPAINSAYRRYCNGLKKADCILVEKTRCGEFMRLVTDPPIPKKRPDLISFIHKPLQHYRDILKILQTIANCKESKELDHHILSKLILELQVTYRDITVESGLMDCGAEGRPILSLQDLESRLVFTRCKPFTLNIHGRKWIFAGDLNRIEGKSIRMCWALLFSDILLFTKINRDKVVFVTEEPLPLATVIETQFNIKKRDTEFRLIIGLPGRGNCNVGSGNNSPAQRGCVPLVHFHSPLVKRTTQNKDIRRRIIVFRAPSPELKAVWQNLIQRQVIKINTTGQGSTPASSPIESPNQLTIDSAATTDTTSTVCKRQCDQIFDDLIEYKCKIIGKYTDKGKAYHLAQWIKKDLHKDTKTPSWVEPEIETWSIERMQQRIRDLDKNLNYEIHSLNEEIDLNDNRSTCTDLIPEAKTNKISSGANEVLSLCQKCHETCLQSNPQNSIKRLPECDSNADAFLDYNNKWNNTSVSTILSPVEPFNPIVSEETSQLDNILNVNIEDTFDRDSEHKETDDENDSNSDDDMPYKSLQECTSSLKRYASISNLNILVNDFEIEKEVSVVNQCKENKPSTENPMMSWTNRASTFVAQKVALLEKFGENVQNSSLLDTFKYLKPSRDYELTSTSQTLAFEEDYENSGGTSGDEFWGTPNSGGASVASNECAALSPSSSHDDDDGDDDSEGKIIEEMLLNRTTAMLAQQHNMTPSRMMQNKCRLEPLPETEEENITKSWTSSSASLSSQATSLSTSDCTMSCPVPQDNGFKSESNNVYSSYVGQSSTVFGNMKLRRSQSMDESNNENEKTERKELRGKKTYKKKRFKLLRFFSRQMPENKKEKEESKFWCKLRK